MKFVKKCAMALGVVIPLLLVGCSQAQHVVALAQNSFVYYSDILHPKEYYKITGETIPHVGKLISMTNLATNGPGYWSSSDNIVAVYTIPGMDSSKEIAVKLKDGTYVTGTAAGSKQP